MDLALLCQFFLALVNPNRFQDVYYFFSPRLTRLTEMTVATVLTTIIEIEPI